MKTTPNTKREAAQASHRTTTADYVCASLLAWQDQAAAAIQQGQSEVDFLAHCHPDNRSNARTAYRTANAALARLSAQPTPGPWGARRCGPPVRSLQVDSCGEPICTVFDHGDKDAEGNIGKAKRTARAEANARLIAAAPCLVLCLQELLALHEESVFVCGSDDESRVGQALCHARNVIRRAGGAL